MDWIAKNTESLLGLLCLTGLCAPGIAFALGAAFAEGTRALLRLAAPRRTTNAKPPPTLPWLIAQWAGTGAGIAAVARVVASLVEVPFSPWGYLATVGGLLALLASIVFTGAGAEGIQAEDPRTTNRNLYAKRKTPCLTRSSKLSLAWPS